MTDMQRPVTVPSFLLSQGSVGFVAVSSNADIVDHLQFSDIAQYTSALLLSCLAC